MLTLVGGGEYTLLQEDHNSQVNKLQESSVFTAHVAVKEDMKIHGIWMFNFRLTFRSPL